MKLKKSTQILLGSSLVIFAIVAATADDPKEEATKASTEVKSEQTANTTENTATETVLKSSTGLFTSADEFKTTFNQFCKKNSFDFRIKNLNISEGEVQNSLQYSFTENLGIIGSIDKTDGSVNELTMIAKGDGTAGSGLDMVSMIAAIIGLADPSLAPTDRGAILDELQLMGDNAADLKDHKATVDKNGIHYFVTCSEMMGIWFGASRE